MILFKIVHFIYEIVISNAFSYSLIFIYQYKLNSTFKAENKIYNTKIMINLYYLILIFQYYLNSMCKKKLTPGQSGTLNCSLTIWNTRGPKENSYVPSFIFLSFFDFSLFKIIINDLHEPHISISFFFFFFKFERRKQKKKNLSA